MVRERSYEKSWSSAGHVSVGNDVPIPNVGDLVYIPKFDVSVPVDSRAFDYSNPMHSVDVSLYVTYYEEHDDALMSELAAMLTSNVPSPVEWV